jgi:SnoaL-like polyketide cyclase
MSSEDNKRLVRRWLEEAWYRVAVTGIEIVRIANGKIAEGWDEMDVHGLLQQLGSGPTPPTPESG